MLFMLRLSGSFIVAGVDPERVKLVMEQEQVDLQVGASTVS